MYQTGVMDQARNYSSAYVEQRFIVDAASPVCTFNLPGATVDPSGDMLIDVSVADGGAGLDDGSVSVTVKDPNGNKLEISDFAVTGDRITGKIEGPLETGDYVIEKIGRKR